MVRRRWVAFQCRGVLQIWIVVGKGPIAIAVGAGGGCLDICSLIYLFPFLSPSLGDGPIYTETLSQRAVKPKNNQPTNPVSYRIQCRHNNQSSEIRKI